MTTQFTEIAIVALDTLDGLFGLEDEDLGMLVDPIDVDTSSLEGGRR